MATKQTPEQKLGSKIDAAFRALDKYRTAQAVADDLKRKADEMRDALLDEMKILKLDKASSALGTVSVSMVDVPQVQDWSQVHAWVIKNKAPELLQKRISTEAWRERVADGRPIPGVIKFVDVKLLMRSK